MCRNSSLFFFFFLNREKFCGWDWFVLHCFEFIYLYLYCNCICFCTCNFIVRICWSRGKEIEMCIFMQAINLNVLDIQTAFLKKKKKLFFVFFPYHLFSSIVVCYWCYLFDLFCFNSFFFFFLFHLIIFLCVTACAFLVFLPYFCSHFFLLHLFPVSAFLLFRSFANKTFCVFTFWTIWTCFMKARAFYNMLEGYCAVF